MYDSRNKGILTSIEKVKDNSSNRVVLSFDDGPSKVLPKILDILKSEEVNALFFWQTRLLYPARPWKRVLEEGHIIGTHTTKHRNLIKLTEAEQYKELHSSKMKIETITGSSINYFRPPYGQYNDTTIKAAKELGLQPVMWKIASMDWHHKENPEEILSCVLENLQDGAIILLHELTQTVKILPELIKQIKAKDYEITLP